MDTVKRFCRTIKHERTDVPRHVRFLCAFNSVKEDSFEKTIDSYSRIMLKYYEYSNESLFCIFGL